MAPLVGRACRTLLAVMAPDAQGGEPCGQRPDQIGEPLVWTSVPRPGCPGFLGRSDESELLYRPGFCVIDHFESPLAVAFPIPQESGCT